MAPIPGARTVDAPTVFVVENDPHVRAALATVIGSADFPVEAFATARAFLDALDEDRPGCIVADLLGPDLGGVELQRLLGTRGCLLPFIILSGYGDVPSAVEAMKAGAVDFIQKPFSVPPLLDAVREALRRNTALRSHRAKRTAAVARLAPLTAREREVLALLVEGHPNKVVAARLGICDNTVENHRAGIMKKTGAGHLAELVRLVLAAEAELEVVWRAPAG
jgi:FixJ family two-component response regulator